MATKKRIDIVLDEQMMKLVKSYAENFGLTVTEALKQILYCQLEEMLQTYPDGEYY